MRRCRWSVLGIDRRSERLSWSAGLPVVLQVLCVCLFVSFAHSLPAWCATRNVVLLFDERPTLPGLARLEAEFSRTLTANSPDPVEIYREPMDLSRFGAN